MILFNPTSSYLWLNKNQGTEVNKNSTSYTSVVSPQKKKKKKKKKKEKKNKERVWGQTKQTPLVCKTIKWYRGSFTRQNSAIVAFLYDKTMKSWFNCNFSFQIFWLEHLSSLEMPYTVPYMESGMEVMRSAEFTGTFDSRYLEIQGTLWNTSRYPYLNISDLQNWKKTKQIEQTHVTN